MYQLHSVREEFEDTKLVIRIRKSNKDRQHNDRVTIAITYTNYIEMRIGSTGTATFGYWKSGELVRDKKNLTFVAATMALLFFEKEVFNV